VPQESEVERGLRRLEGELKRLEAEYNMFFAGRLPRPPWETRTRVEGLVKQYDRAYIQNYGDRFRFQTLQSRFASLVELWDRGMRAREEGRPGPFAAPKTEPREERPKAKDQIVCVSSFRDPAHETDKLHELYDSLAEARRSMGEQSVPFGKFAELVENQVRKLQQSGSPEVAFRVAIKDGKVHFTARGLKGVKE
jgi:hypothetical protein